MPMTKLQRKSFAKIKAVAELPDLLNIQLQSFEQFLQPDVDPEKRENKGLQFVFNGIFHRFDSQVPGRSQGILDH